MLAAEMRSWADAIVCLDMTEISFRSRRRAHKGLPFTRIPWTGRDCATGAAWAGVSADMPAEWVLANSRGRLEDVVKGRSGRRAELPVPRPEKMKNLIR